MKRFVVRQNATSNTRQLWIVDKLKSWVASKALARVAPAPSASSDPAGPLSIKQVMDAATLMNQLQQAQAKGANPMTALKPEQMEKLRQMLDAQKQMPGAAANPMLKILEQQLNSHAAPKGLPAAPVSRAAVAGKTPSALPPVGSGKPLPKPAPGSIPQPSTTRPSTPVSPAAPQPPGAQTPTTPDLGPEIEALFTELKSMRIAKNEYKTKYEAQERLTQSALADVARLTTVSDDLRARLKRAEHELSLVTSDMIHVTDQAKEAKASAKALQEAKAEVASLRAQIAAGSATATKEFDTAASREVRQLRRKIERLRRASPAQQLLHVFSTIVKSLAVGDEPPMPPPLSDAVNEFQQSVADAAMAEWPATAVRCGGPKTVALVAQSFWAKMVPFGLYDARVSISGNHDEFVKAFRLDDRFTVSVEVSESGPTVVTLLAKDSFDPSTQVGPTAIARGWVEAGKGASAVSYTVAPFISQAMLDNSKRTQITIEHSRSSGPGGQAANVSETNITATLVVDGAAVARTRSQESRSNLINERVAREKLLNEGLTKYNHTVGREAANQLRFAPKPSVSKSTWDLYAEPLVAPTSAVDQRLIESMKSLIVNPSE